MATSHDQRGARELLDNGPELLRLADAPQEAVRMLGAADAHSALAMLLDATKKRMVKRLRRQGLSRKRALAVADATMSDVHAYNDELSRNPQLSPAEIGAAVAKYMADRMTHHLSTSQQQLSQ